MLPEPVAAACWAFILGPLADNPRRLGKPLRPPLAPVWSARRGEFRVIYHIYQKEIVIHIIRIQHRRDAYRS